MATIEKAIQIAARAHEGQVDKQGSPTSCTRCGSWTAWRGWTPRSSPCSTTSSRTPGDLRRPGAGGVLGEVLAAVRCVTHAEGESYADYVVRCRADAIARRVKLSDLADNTRLSRTIVRPLALARDTARFAKYLLSHSFLTGQVTEEQYRAAMPEFEG